MTHKRKKIPPMTVAVYLILTVAAVCCIAPFVLMISASFTDELSIVSDGYNFWPQKFSIEAYRYLSANATYLLHAYGITILVTICGTAVNLLLTLMLAYAISRQDLPGRKVLNFMVVFIMLFNGGLVPTYLVYTEVFHIKNTIFGLLVPLLMMGAFNVMLARSYFQNSVPFSIIEAARIDGAGEFFTFWRVVIPLSLPIIATIGLFVGVAYWNDWYNGMIYITKPELYSIQNVLNQMLTNIQFLKNNTEASAAATGTIPSSSVRMAIAAVAVIPIMVVYPFFQKYFVKGIALGGVKE